MSCCQPPIVFPPCPAACPSDTLTVTLENGNLTGIGVYDNTSGTVAQFRGIVGDGTYITAALDAPNKSITLTFDASAISGGVPAASETTAGKAELATQTETNTGTDDARIVTPLKLANRTATESRSGILEIATQTETNTGTDDARAVTPLKLSVLLASKAFTTTFNDSIARAAAAPDFKGQLGVQQDSLQVYVGASATAGDWNTVLTGGAINVLTGSTTVDFTGGVFSLVSAAGAIGIDDTEATVTLNFSSFNGGKLQAGAGGYLDLLTTGFLQIDSANMTANSLLSTSGTAGVVQARAVANFVSSYNTQTGWSVSGTSTNRTLTNASSTTDVLNALATLIQDLKAIKLPAT